MQECRIAYIYLSFNNNPLNFNAEANWRIYFKISKENNLSECRNLYWKLNNKCVADP